MIRAIDVHKSYSLGGREVQALRGLHMAIDQPGFYGIMGASGSGKSTFLHLLAALDRPSQGQLFIDGQGLHEMSEQQLTLFRRRKIGIVFQQFNLIPTLTAIENVELPGALAGDEPGALRKRAASLLDSLGLSGRHTHRPDTLSGGEQQRVAIARALLFKPPLILADEPTGNLDSVSSAKLWKLLAEVAAEHQITVVMVTHEPAAAAHCRRVFVLQDGLVIGQIDTEGTDAAGLASRYQDLVRAA